MTRTPHDTLVVRLAQILVKLNQGEKLEPAALAAEFGVNLRTVQRDLNERFAYLPLVKTEGRYHLDPAFLGKIGPRDIERFAGLAGIRGLFPSLSDDFLRDIFDARLQSAILVKGHHYENLAGKEQTFRQLEEAIVARHLVSFSYAKDDTLKAYSGIAPYKLINAKGIWYLAAVDDGKLKTFAFSKISALAMSFEVFDADSSIEQTIATQEGVWFGGAQTEIVLKVSSEVGYYFKRRALIANQVIEKELVDGGLIVSARVGHVNQVLPIVRYWIPHVRIISPESLQADMERDLKSYLT